MKRNILNNALAAAALAIGSAMGTPAHASTTGRLDACNATQIEEIRSEISETCDGKSGTAYVYCSIWANLYEIHSVTCAS